MDSCSRKHVQPNGELNWCAEIAIHEGVQTKTLAGFLRRGSR